MPATATRSQQFAEGSDVVSKAEESAARSPAIVAN